MYANLNFKILNKFYDQLKLTIRADTVHHCNLAVRALLLLRYRCIKNSLLMLLSISYCR